MERFEIARVKDFKAVILKYLEEQMTHQLQVSKQVVNISHQSMCYYKTKAGTNRSKSGTYTENSGF